jgi:hypothetical protein
MQDQVYYYIKGTRYKLVLLANFGTSKVGIKRLIYTIRSVIVCFVSVIICVTNNE